ncbi:MAG: SDR family oxidoreductase [Trueperaceae bacterium]|nr:SDR family oxidoreductase [Trueperaceae bacterium]
MSTTMITGASSGIGRELARAFARRGHDLILTARTTSRLEELREELRQAHGSDVTTITADLAREDGPRALLRALNDAGHEVDVLVNNAGVANPGAFDEVPLEEVLAEVRLDVVAVTHLARALLPGMRRRGRGGVMNVASTAAFQPGPGMAVYYASKAFVLHLSEALAEEVRGSGVRVTALCPGPTVSEFHARADMEETRLVRLVPMQDAAHVAEAGVRAFERGQHVFVPGTSNRAGARLARLAPRPLVARLVAWLHRPARGDDRGR